jgi:hypothetical protein
MDAGSEVLTLINFMRLKLSKFDVAAAWQTSIWAQCAPLGSDGLILGFEIELDLHVVGVTEENLPTSTIRHLVYLIEHALAGEVLLHRFEAAAAERNMIDDA